MRRALFQGAIIVGMFFSILFVFRQINWMSVLKVEQTTEQTEEKLGELLLEIIKKTEKENDNPLVKEAIDSIITKICTKNKIERHTIKAHILQKKEVNAFALPDGHLIIYTGLILAADNQEELSGVICHEIAHVELNHVMRKLIKEVGLSALISMTAGSNGAEMIKGTVKTLSSSAFDRDLEKEADIKAVDYLIEAEINPESFANFLYKLSYRENDIAKYLSWISTHPESKERAEYIIAYSRDKVKTNKPIIMQETWGELLEVLRSN